MRRSSHSLILSSALLVASCDDDGSPGASPASDASLAAQDTNAVDAPPARTLPPAQTLPPAWGGRFTDLTETLTSPASAIYLQAPMRMGKDPEPINGVSVDLEGDGTTEVLFATTYDNSEGRRTAIFDLLPDGAGLRFRSHFRTRSGPDRLNVMGLVDLDGDGHVDALLNRANFELAWGVGGGEFADPAPLRHDAPMGEWRPPHRAMHVTDLDHDGWLDVITGTGQCCSTCLAAEVYLQVAPRRFERHREMIPMEPGATAYAIVDGTLAGRRTVFMVGQNCGNTDVPVFYRETPLDPQGYPHFEPFDPTPRTSFIRTSDPAWPIIEGQSIQHWVPMGLALGDVNNDLRNDVAMSLNFFAGLWVDEGAMPLRDLTAQFGAMPHLAASGRRMIPWGMALVDLDRDGRNDLVVAHGNDHTAEVAPESQIGPQRTIIEWNAGDGQFVDATEALGVGRPGQYHSLYVDDLDRDGAADVLVGALDEHPRVLLNRIDRGQHGFSLRLRGTSSNLLGIGARVRVEVTPGAAPLEFEAGSVGSPGVVVDPITFVGLGEATRAARVRVTWPSGVVQERADVPAGAMHVWEEPRLFAVEPATRHVARGGVATVTVTPRAPDGSLRPGAAVQARLLGPGALASSTVEGVTTLTITHPGASGSSVLTLSLDGVDVGVRPRIWWDG